MRQVTLKEFCDRAVRYERWRGPMVSSLRRGAWGGIVVTLGLGIGASAVYSARQGDASGMSRGCLVVALGYVLVVAWLIWRTAGFRYGNATLQLAAAVLSDIGAWSATFLVWSGFALGALMLLVAWSLMRLVWSLIASVRPAPLQGDEH